MDCRTDGTRTMLTVHQTYILEILGQLHFVELDTLCWLMRRRFGSTRAQVESDLRALRYLQRLRLGENCAFLPGRKRDARMAAALEVMKRISGRSLPTLVRGTPPYLLSFFLSSGDSLSVYKVAWAQEGREELLRCQVEADPFSPACVTLFLIRRVEQIPLLQGRFPAYYVLSEEGNLRFLQTPGRR